MKKKVSILIQYLNFYFQSDVYLSLKDIFNKKKGCDFFFQIMFSTANLSLCPGRFKLNFTLNIKKYGKGF